MNSVKTIEELNAGIAEARLTRSELIASLVSGLNAAADENDAVRAHELLKGADFPVLVAAWNEVTRDLYIRGDKFPRAKWFHAVMGPYILEGFNIAVSKEAK